MWKLEKSSLLTAKNSTKAEHPSTLSIQQNTLESTSKIHYPLPITRIPPKITPAPVRHQPHLKNASAFILRAHNHTHAFAFFLIYKIDTAEEGRAPHSTPRFIDARDCGAGMRHIARQTPAPRSLTHVGMHASAYCTHGPICTHAAGEPVPVFPRRIQTIRPTNGLRAIARLTPIPSSSWCPDCYCPRPSPWWGTVRRQEAVPGRATAPATWRGLFANGIHGDSIVRVHYTGGGCERRCLCLLAEGKGVEESMTHTRDFLCVLLFCTDFAGTISDLSRRGLSLCSCGVRLFGEALSMRLPWLFLFFLWDSIECIVEIFRIIF